jgi:peptide/nickel transport system substrate-binding protein
MFRLFSQIGVMSWLFLGLVALAQPPRVEEEEEPTKKKDSNAKVEPGKKEMPKVEVPKKDPPKVEPGKTEPAKTAPMPRKDPVPVVPTAPRTAREIFININVKRESESHPHQEVKKFFKDLFYPYDYLDTKDGSRYKLLPVPVRELDETLEEHTFAVLSPSLTSSTEQTFRKANMRLPIKIWEEFVLARVESFSRDPIEGLPRTEQIEIALKGVIATMEWHDAARAANRRTGEKWDVVRKNLDQARNEMEFRLIDLWVVDKNFGRAEPLLAWHLNEDPNNIRMKGVYHRIRLQRFEELIKSNKATDEELRESRLALVDYERLLPSKTDPLSANVRKLLRERAERYLADAKDLAGKNLAAQALGRLRTAESLAPELPAIRDIRSKIRDRILFVAVSKIPERLSPATARLDAERWGVELLFERLMQPMPDKDLGMIYRPWVAKDFPKVTPMSREIQLIPGIRWNREVSTEPIDAMEFRATVQGMQTNATVAFLSGCQDVTAVDRIDNPYQFRLGLKPGILDPLAALSFHIQPAKWLQGQGKTLDDAGFSRNPFGSGPYRLDGREADGLGRDSLIFRASATYSQRPGKIGLPIIPEIRFVVPRKDAVLEDFRTGQLHLMLDPSMDLWNRFREDNGGVLGARAYAMKQPNRIHILAMNHRLETLASEETRRGIGFCLNREAILAPIRVANLDMHAPMKGPFPPGSWAEPAQAGTLDRNDAGKALLQEQITRTRPMQFTLLYSTDDPRNESIANSIKIQLEQVPKLTINLEAVNGAALERRVEVEHDFELALTKMDYADARFQLSPYFNPELAGRGGLNWFGLQVDPAKQTDRDRRLGRLVEEVTRERDFQGVMREKMNEIHQLFIQQMPFIPLWQLDRLGIVSNALDIHLGDAAQPILANQLEPTRLFITPERWQLK